MIVGEQLPDPILFVSLLSEARGGTSPEVVRQERRNDLQVLTAFDLVVVATAALPIRYGMDDAARENFGGS